MFKKTLYAMLTLLMCAVLFAGCGAYKLPKVTGGPDAGVKEESNGGMAVKKGNYLYFINGTSTQTADNKYGDAVKGALVRVNLNNLDETVMIAPKVVLSSYSKGGIWIFGDRIYYTSPSQERNKNKEILTSYLDFFSCKLDGTDTKKIMTTVSNSNAFVFFEEEGTVYINYIATGTYKDADTSQVFLLNTATGTRTTLITNYVNAPIFCEDGYIYYDQTIPKEDEEDVNEPYNAVMRIHRAGGTAEAIKIGDDDIFEGTAGEKYIIKLEDVKVFNGKTTLFYTRTSVATTVVPTLKGATCSFTFGDTAEKRVYSGQSEGVDYTDRLYVSPTSFLGMYNGSLYYVTSEGGYAFTEVMNITPAKKLYIDGDYLYYIQTAGSINVFSRVNYKREQTKKEVEQGILLKDVSVSTSGLSPELIDGYLYFVRADGDKDEGTFMNYMYRIKADGTQFEAEDAELISLVADADLPSPSPDA